MKTLKIMCMALLVVSLAGCYLSERIFDVCFPPRPECNQAAVGAIHDKEICVKDGDGRFLWKQIPVKRLLHDAERGW